MNITIDRILFCEPVVAGMNYLQVAALTYRLRSSNWDAEPVTVRVEGDYLRLIDGRHRVIAHLFAGRKVVPAVVVE